MNDFGAAASRGAVVVVVVVVRGIGTYVLNALYHCIYILAVERNFNILIRDL